MKKIKYIVLFAALILAASCKQQDPQNSEAPPTVFITTQAIALDTVFAREFVAEIQSMQHVEIRSRINGFLEKIHADEGAEVKAGQLLFSLGNRAYKEALRKAQAMRQSAEAEAKMAEMDLANTRLLAEKKIVSQTELNMATAKLEAALAKIEEAKAEVSAAELTLSFSEIRAPFSGILNREPLKVGSMIEEGDLLTTLSSNHDVFTYFNVSEKEYLEWMHRKDDQWKKNLSLILADGRLHQHKGVIETAETVVDKATGSIAFRARFPNPGHLLKHGASGKVLVYESLKNALVVPQKSTFDVQDKTYVFVVDEEGTIRRRAIQTQLRLGHLYVVESGLSTEDQLIYEGVQLLKEGQKVQTQLMPMRQIIPTLAMR